MTRLTIDDLHVSIERLFRTSGTRREGPGAVGVELELIPLRAEHGEETRQIPLASLLPFLRARLQTLGRVATGGPQPGFELAGGGRITFEPGGQLEYSGPPALTGQAAGSDLRRVMGGLRQAGAESGFEFADVGIVDPMSAGQVELQVAGDRYLAMKVRFDRIGPWGRVMMCRTASMQLNLDFGQAAREANERWRLCNLLTPVLGGAFANSPMILPDGSRAVSGRLWIWRRLDPGRTGFVSASPGERPDQAYLRFALAAPLMSLHEDAGDAAESGRTFGDWLEDAGADQGPSLQDWEVHLTTLFPHVRPRGWIELRFFDTPREEWWDVPIVLASALIYDCEARRAATGLLEPLESRLQEFTEVASIRGLSDPELGDLAEGLFELALRGADRMPGYFGAAQVSAAEEFLSRFTSRRRTQADEDDRAGG